MVDEDGFDQRWHGAFIPSQHWHFHRRLLSRYGIVLRPGDFSAMVRALANGTAVPVERRSGKGAIYSVRVRSARTRIYVVAIGTHLITAWPPSAHLNGLRRQRSAAADPSVSIPAAREA